MWVTTVFAQSVPFAGELVYEEPLQNLKVVITDQKCSEPTVLKLIRPEFVKHFYNGLATIDGVDYPLCWAMAELLFGPDVGRGYIYLIDNTGDNGPLEMKKFAKPDYL